MRIRAKKSSENSVVTKTHLQSLVRMAKYDVETLVYMQIFLSVFWNPEVLKTEVFENTLVWTGPTIPAISEARLFFLIQSIITNRCLLKSIFDCFRFTQFLENYNKREANLENSAGNFIPRKMIQTKARYGKLKQMLINFKGPPQTNKVF